MAFVNMLADLTETGAIKWTQSYVGNKLVFKTTFKNRILRFYEIHRPSTITTGLDFVDDNGASLWMFPVDVSILQKAVKSKSVNIDGFIREAISEAGYS